MTAFYNEIDPFACQWTRNLIAAGQITPGVVDERSIAELGPDDVRGVERVHFFSGIAGWDLALNLAGWSGPVWTGSCPCQPFSRTGKRRAFTDDRHLWPVWRELIRECAPPVVFGEQTSGGDGIAWFDAVSADLELAGYAVGRFDIPACGVGAPHIRQRIYFAAIRVGDAYQDDAGRHGRAVDRPQEEVVGEDWRIDRGDGDAVGPSGGVDPWLVGEWLELTDGTERPTGPGVPVVAPRLPGDLARLGAIGNAICVPLAATFVRCVMAELGMRPIARAA